jgi:endonuclease V-like protein UPF0215 family
MNINNPSMQDLEDAMKEKFDKEDAYWKALEKAQEEAYYKAMDE